MVMGTWQQLGTEPAQGTHALGRSWRGQAGQCLEGQWEVQQGAGFGAGHWSSWGHHVQAPLSCCIQGKGQSLAVQLSGGSALRPPCSAPGFLGGCCETSGGRHGGMAVTSPMPCTLSASQPCSTSTWQRSPTPSPSGACWGMQLPTCRSVWPLGTNPALHGHPTQPSPEDPWVPTSYQRPQEHPEHRLNSASFPGGPQH